MKKIAIACAAAVALAMAVGVAQAQGRGGGGWSGGGSGWRGGSWSGGGSGWRGGSWNGGWGWRGGTWGNPGWNGRVWYGGWGRPWYGGWWGWGPNVNVVVGAPVGWWGWGGWPAWGATAWTPGFTEFADTSVGTFVETPWPAQSEFVAPPASSPAPPQNRAPAAPAYWYYCTNPAGYYPYVQNCNKPWVPVIPSANPQSAIPGGSGQ